MKSQKTGNAPGYSVRAACKRLGIGPHTLRAWENRYQAVEPARTDTGHRIYSDSELGRLETILRLVNLGHSVGVIAALPDTELRRLMKLSGANASEADTGSDVLESFLGDLEPAVRRFDFRRVSSLLDQKRTTLGTRGFVLQVLSPLIRWMGGMIENESMSVAHEHALSAVARDQIYQVLRFGSASLNSKTLPRFVLATPEDDLHEFGILLSGALLSHYGLQGHFLGPDLPAEALAVSVRAIRGDIVLLGNAPVPEQERRISLEEYLRVLHSRLPIKVAVWIGGAGAVPHLRRVMPGREHRLLASLNEFDAVIARLS